MQETLIVIALIVVGVVFALLTLDIVGMLLSIPIALANATRDFMHRHTHRHHPALD